MMPAVADRWLIGIAVAFVGRSQADSSYSSRYPNVEFVPLLQFYGQTERELEAQDLPVRTCTSQRAAPAWYTQPFVRTRLHIERIAPQYISQEGWLWWNSRPAYNLDHVQPQRFFCRWSRAASSLPWLCQDCTKNPCTKSARAVRDSGDYFVELPSIGESCVIINDLPKYASKVRVAWEDPDVDRSVLVLLVAGSALVRCYQDLRESKMFHAAIGGVLSIAVVFLFVAWWFFSNSRNALGAPLGSFVSFLAVTAFSYLYLGTPIGSYNILDWLNTRDPMYNLPIGWIVAAVLVCLFLTVIWFGANMTVQFFRSADEPDPRQVPFEIGSDGRRIDILPPTRLPQRCLGWLLWLVGIITLLQSTHSDEWSLGLAMVVNFLSTTEYIILDLFTSPCPCPFRNNVTPASLRPLVSAEEYQQQTRRTTQVALDKLQRHLQRNKSLMLGLGDNDTELRLRRFADTGIHALDPCASNFYDGGARRCMIL